jgi:hypothetical protein
VTQDAARMQDLAGIDAMLSSFAGALRNGILAAMRENSLRPNETEAAKTSLKGKFRCSALRVHQINKKMLESLPGYQKLVEACRKDEIGAAFSLSVCHFKPGPDQDGLYKIKNPEALVIVRADPERTFDESTFTFYPDVYAGTMQVELGLNDTGVINLPKTLKLTAGAPQKPQMRLRLKPRAE